MARLGGDEFAIITTNFSHIDECEIVVQKIFDSFQQDFMVSNHPVSIGVSIGIALYPKDAQTEEELILKSDKAMYSAKKSGKRCVRFYE